jgi:sialate O-acetylesterase
MRFMLKLFSFSIMWLLLVNSNVSAKVLLPQILASNMVLQRNKPINIWGFASPGEKISVDFAGQIKTTTTDQKGNWLVVLAPLKASSIPQNMRIEGANRIMLTNILIGEVWVCSGQSNMEYAMRKLIKIPKPLNEKLGFPQNEVATSKSNLIRIFLVNRKQLIKPDSVHKSWSSVTEDSALRAFSAVGYFFAKELQQKLGIPIGMIESAVSGSAIEPWIEKNALVTADYFKDKKVGNDPGKFFTPMIEPLSLYKIRGFLWYQGETNCFLNEDISYAYKMKTLINSWRNLWNDGNLPFYYVQIAPYNYSKHSGQVVLDENTQPDFWEAQAQLLRLPNTGMVVTTDLNDNGEDLHPTYKWEIGRRLAIMALAKEYGRKIEFTGPMYQSMKINANKIEITFSNVGKGLSLVVAGGNTGFYIAGDDEKYYKANATVNGDKLTISSVQVPKPKNVRFNWTENPFQTLFNSIGIPAMPFRTNNPLTPQFKHNSK